MSEYEWDRRAPRRVYESWIMYNDSKVLGWIFAAAVGFLIGCIR